METHPTLSLSSCGTASATSASGATSCTSSGEPPGPAFGRRCWGSSFFWTRATLKRESGGKSTSSSPAIAEKALI